MFWPFVTGFLVGVIVSIAALLVLIYKFLLRKADQPPIDNYYTATHSEEGIAAKDRGRDGKEKSGKQQKGNAGTVGYISDEGTPDVITHKETSDWLNIIVQRLFDEVTSQPNVREFLVDRLNTELNAVNKPDVVGTINVEDVDLGSTLPRLSHIVTKKKEGGLQFEFGVSYTGGAFFKANTELWLNWPQKGFASLPVGFSVTFTAFKARLQMKSTPVGPDARWSFALVGEPLIDVEICTVLGYDKKLRDVPKLTDFIMQQLRQIIAKELVLPNGFSFQLPLMGKELDLMRLAELSEATNNNNNNKTKKSDEYSVDDELAWSDEGGEKEKEKEGGSERGWKDKAAVSASSTKLKQRKSAGSRRKEDTSSSSTSSSGGDEESARAGWQSGGSSSEKRVAVQKIVKKQQSKKDGGLGVYEESPSTIKRRSRKAD